MPIKDAPKKEPPSYDQVMQQADMLTKASPPLAYSKLMDDLLKAKLDGIQTEHVLILAAKKLGIAVRILRKEYKANADKLQNSNDLGFIIAKQTLKESYADGLFLKRQAGGMYYVYDKSHWRLTAPDVVRGNIQKVASKHLPKTNKTLAALVGDTIRCLDDLLASDEDLLGMADELPPIINCTNAELWIDKQGVVEPKLHNPASRLFSCLSYPYEPQATCPKFDDAILGIFAKSSNPKDMVRHFEEILGYAVSARRHIAMFILLIGQGNNGKSKLLETVQRLIGEHAVMSDSLGTFQKDKFNTAALHGKLLFCDDDLNFGVTLNDGLIKKLSESKLVSARHVYGRKFTFRSLALPIIASNDYPNTHDISHGMIRRVHVIPFDRQFTPTEDNKELFPSIWDEEMSGVLNRALAGLQRLLERGKFLEPADCIKGRHDFLAHANPLFAFLQEGMVKDPNAELKVQDFRYAFASWAKQQGVTINKEAKRLIRQLRGLENVFSFKVTKPEDMKKVAYPKLYGLAFKSEAESE